VSIFKACDIRGVYGRDLTEETIHRIGRAMGTLIGPKSVVVGGDVRLSTPSLKAALVSGLVESGARVIDTGIVPTPAFYFAKDHLNADAGAMVTASHNPPEHNGLKLVLGPLPITEEELRTVRDLSAKGEFTAESGSVREVNIIPSYISFIHRVAPGGARAHSSTIILDCGNGCYSDIAPGVFRDFGYGIEELFCTPDGGFPNRHPNSAIAEHLHELRRRVLAEGADLGVAFDGDGDRVSFVDDKGRFLSSDKAIIILSRHIPADNPNQKVIYDVKCSSAVAESVSRAGGLPIAERSGHAFIKARMISEDAAFGGELSGHYFYRELHGGDDGLYTALVMADILSGSGNKLSEIADAIPEYATTPDIRIPFDGDREQIIERIASCFPPEEVSRLDGVKINFGDGWGLARVSVTEPAITLRFEAVSENRLREIVDRFLDPVPEIRRISEGRGILRGRSDAEA
jgi:phosphomannomutase/phosphoglucomutase